MCNLFDININWKVCCRIYIRINVSLIGVHPVGCEEESVKLSAHFCKYNFGDKRSINDILRVEVQVCRASSYKNFKNYPLCVFWGDHSYRTSQF